MRQQNHFFNVFQRCASHGVTGRHFQATQSTISKAPFIEAELQIIYTRWSVSSITELVMDAFTL